MVSLHVVIQKFGKFRCEFFHQEKKSLKDGELTFMPRAIDYGGK